MRELIVVKINGSKYGVWKDEVLSTRDVRTIHGLPMTPEMFSGVTEMEGRMANLFDLPVCLGHGPFDRKRPGRVLIMSERGKPEGFVFGEEEGSLDVPHEDVFPMPLYMRSPVLEECVHHADGLIPVVNVKALYTRIRRSEWERPVFTFTGGDKATSEAPTGMARVFTLAGEAFAVPAGSVEEEAENPEHLCVLPLAPFDVEGVVFRHGSVRPVLDLKKYMKIEGEAGHLMLLARDGGPGLLVDSDMGTPGGETALLPMPPLAASGLMQFALAREGEVIPLLHIPALLSRDTGTDMAGGYSPRSKFVSLFGRKEAKVLEFTIPGMGHSVPDSQVEDIIGAKPYRALRGIHPMMPGVAEHKGEILPVLDIGVCFGRRTRMAPGSSMILLKNGNFRALVLADSIAGRRLLSVQEQRELPINLPRMYVYGCYPHENTVRLVLNVETLANHFDQRLVDEYFETLSKEISAENETEIPDGGPVAGVITEALQEAEQPALMEGVEAGGAGAEEATAQTAFPADMDGEATQGHEEEGDASTLEDSGPLTEQEAEQGTGALPESETVEDETPGEVEESFGGKETEEVLASGEEPEDGPVEETEPPEDMEPPIVEQETEQGETMPPGAADSLDVAARDEDNVSGPEGKEPELEEKQEEEDVLEDSGPVMEQDAERWNEALPESAVVEGETPGEVGESFVEEETEEVLASGEEPEDGPVEETEPPEDMEPPIVEQETEQGETMPPGAADSLDVAARDEDSVSGPEGQEPEVEEKEEEESSAAGKGPEKPGEEESDERKADELPESIEAPVTGAAEGPVEAPMEPQREEVEREPSGLAEETVLLSRETAGLEGITEKQAEAEESDVKAPETAPGHMEEYVPPAPEFLGESSRRGPRKNVAYAAAAVLLVVLILLGVRMIGPGEEDMPRADVAVSDSQKDAGREPAMDTGPTPLAAPEASVDTVTDAPAKEVETVETEDPSSRAGETRDLSSQPPAPEKTSAILLEVKPSRSEISMRTVETEASDPRLYVVRKGDTLWHIAERFTGNPFNYPRIAEESEIKNPDLIFPGQQVLIEIKGE